jgi:hypothetical protein
MVSHAPLHPKLGKTHSGTAVGQSSGELSDSAKHGYISLVGLDGPTLGLL